MKKCLHLNMRKSWINFIRTWSRLPKSRRKLRKRLITRKTRFRANTSWKEIIYKSRKSIIPWSKKLHIMTTLIDWKILCISWSTRSRKIMKIMKINRESLVKIKWMISVPKTTDKINKWRINSRIGARYSDLHLNGQSDANMIRLKCRYKRVT